ncbi:histidinol-phosphate aminotransferase [Candidatus Vecturithrix granuli]|uniref:Histidinol-phosphate aminotransferase n=1 Tax=Vecturithrix granuli TaxID=1499967 RepID=A0A081C608_VECG1|nr:histidinol-phosphate aminotransferase [Candidatus Vecturithrix granuli]
MDIQQLVPPHILEIASYQTGKPLEELQKEFGISEFLHFESNENPLGPSPIAVAAMQQAILQANRYPDGVSFALRKALAQKHDVTMAQVLVGSGLDEVISLLMRAFLTSADEIVLSQYSFIMYALNAQAIGVKRVIVPAQANYVHDLDAIAEAVTEKTKMIFLDNPNNPTGTMVNRAAFDAFLQRVPEHVIVVTDEAYDDYVEAEDFPQTLSYLKQGRWLALLKTFSKIYGLAGLRIGYCLAPEALIEVVNRIRPPYNVNLIAQAAALAALTDTEHVQRSREVNLQGKRYLYRAFEEIGLPYIPTQGNFILIDCQRDAATIAQKLLRSGVIVRPVKGYGLPQHLRITIGTQAQNERLVATLRQALQKSV